ncbi:unnamed protein product [Auanema sp. JU1783]|nr:unnamed protein product [Auanema sp. JU1783]
MSSKGGSISSTGDVIISCEVKMCEMSGWLYKWTNYLKGYRQRWFVLDSEAVLSYYRNPSEVGQACRGSINLKEANILSDKDTNSFVITAHSQSYHLKTQNDIDRNNWRAALERQRLKAIKQAESDEDDDALMSAGESRAQSLKGDHDLLSKKLHDLKIVSKDFEKQGEDLVKCVNEGECDKKILIDRVRQLMSNAYKVSQTSSEFVDLSDRGFKKLEKIVTSGQRERKALHEQLEELAKQLSSLERAATVSSNNYNPPLSAYSDQEDEFHDAEEELIMNERNRNDMENSDLRVMKPFINTQKASTSPHQQVSLCRKAGPVKQRRKKIPDRPDLPINLWSIMKNCIGKDLSKIPMPVNFSEPLSVLQRVTEDLEYAHLLEEAAQLDSLQQLCYVAAYAVSNYSTTGNRTNKPFNPLLGETYECDRLDDLGWRSISEQVSHHPPAAAQHAEGNGWVMFQDFALTSRFRGKYLSVIPVGSCHVHFPGSGDKYSYKKITTTVHNIIVGKLWIDNHGEMDIVNHRTGEKCNLKFIPYSYFSKETPRKIYGIVRDASDEPKYVVQGTWDKYVEMVKVVRCTGSGSKQKIETDENPRRIWTCHPPYPGADKMHNFTKFAIELNDPDDEVAPTDTRFRPDQRLMENGFWDESNKKKLEVEEKQRAVRRKREAEIEKAMVEGRGYEEYTPLWFTKTQDELTGALIHKFKYDYWDCKERHDWSRCPNIF